MSLINQMLRDLEERQAAPSAAFEASLQTPVVMALPANGNRRRLKYLLLALLAAASLALLAWLWHPADTPGADATPRSPVVAAGDSDPATGPLAEPSATADNATPAEQPAAASPATGAARAHASAPPRAPAIVEPQGPARPVASSPRETAKASPAPRPRVAAVPDTPSGRTTKPAPVTRQAAVEAARRPSGPRHIEISERTPTINQQAQRRYSEAVKTLRAGDTGTCLQQLAQALELDPGHHQARLLLASLNINRQHKQQAEILLAEGLALDPGHAAFAKLHAQLLIEQAREQEALQSLQSALPGAGRDAEYHALLAGLHRHNGDAVKAAEHYQTALRYAPAHGEWWMGLGLSLEQAGNVAGARSAYGQSLKLPLNAALQNYVATRLKRLSRNPQPAAKAMPSADSEIPGN